MQNQTKSYDFPSCNYGVMNTVISKNVRTDGVTDCADCK